MKNLFNHLHMFKEIYYKRNRSDYKERCRAKNSFALQMNIKMSSHAQNNLIQNESFATKKSSKEFHNLKFTEVQYRKLFEICRSNNMLSLLIHLREQFKVQIHQNSMKWKPCTRILLSFIWTTAVRPFFGT